MAVLYLLISATMKTPVLSANEITTPSISYSGRKPTPPNRLHSPIPSTPSPHEGISRSSTYEKLSSNEKKEESPSKKNLTATNIKSKNKTGSVCIRDDPPKPSSEISTASHIKEQNIPKENSRGQIPLPASKSRLPAAGQKVSPLKASPQKSENKGSRSDAKPVAAIVSPFNYNPSSNIPKSKNDIVPSKSMIPSPKNISSRTSSGSPNEANEGKRVRRTCLVTMV